MELQGIREDWRIIAQQINNGAKVLDIGCGDGELLQILRLHKAIDGRGIELSNDGVSKAVSLGLSVIQGDADYDLDDFPDGCFDYVILSKTLQATKYPLAVMENLLRIGRRVIVSIPNFGYWQNRLYFGFKGRMPVTSALSYEWYDTPNIHFCTLRDFVELCKVCGGNIAEIHIIRGDNSAKMADKIGIWENLIASSGVFVLGG